MATREENIKKINSELEKLDDEQLEQVAGGKWWELDEAVKPKQEKQNSAQGKLIERW